MKTFNTDIIILPMTVVLRDVVCLWTFRPTPWRWVWFVSVLPSVVTTLSSIHPVPRVDLALIASPEPELGMVVLVVLLDDVVNDAELVTLGMVRVVVVLDLVDVVVLGVVEIVVDVVGRGVEVVVVVVVVVVVGVVVDEEMVGVVAETKVTLTYSVSNSFACILLIFVIVHWHGIIV